MQMHYTQCRTYRSNILNARDKEHRERINTARCEREKNRERERETQTDTQMKRQRVTDGDINTETEREQGKTNTVRYSVCSHINL